MGQKNHLAMGGGGLSAPEKRKWAVKPKGHTEHCAHHTETTDSKSVKQSGKDWLSDRI